MHPSLLVEVCPRIQGTPGRYANREGREEHAQRPNDTKTRVVDTADTVSASARSVMPLLLRPRTLTSITR